MVFKQQKSYKGNSRDCKNRKCLSFIEYLIVIVQGLAEKKRRVTCKALKVLNKVRLVVIVGIEFLLQEEQLPVVDQGLIILTEADQGRQVFWTQTYPVVKFHIQPAGGLAGLFFQIAQTDLSF